MRKITIAVSMLLSLKAVAQTGAYNEQALAYIRQYKDLAISEQQRSGVPAAITLAQGIHETQAGTSELATEANNHFGIKCKKEWQGETYAHTDDAPNECFRKYAKATDSYRDHSDYLRNSKRYQTCFDLNITDYAAWAAELKRCGYATNPRYAQKLIHIVEDFHLQDYTYAAMGKGTKGTEEVYVAAAPVKEQRAIVNKEQAGEVVPEKDAAVVVAEEVTAAPVQQPVIEEVPYEEPVPVYGQTVQRNGLKGFYARKGDVLLEPAIKYNVRYARILELNDLPDAPVAADMFIYLEKKHATGSRRTHPVKAGETMAQIAQAEGIQLKSLRNLNQMDADEEPAEGTVLNLQTGVASKPSVRRKDNTAPVYAYRQNKVEETYTPPVAENRERKEVREEKIAAPVAEVVKEERVVTTPAPKRVEVLNPEPAVIAKQTAPVEVIPNDAVKEEETDKEEQPVAAPAVVEQPVEKPVVRRPQQAGPRPQPKPAPPKQKTFTIADEMAVGEENGDKQTYSPRYVAQNTPSAEPVTTSYSPPPPSAYTGKPLTEEPMLKRVAAPRDGSMPVINQPKEEVPVVVKQEPLVKQDPVAKQEPVVREEDLPQDEFSKLKRQLDKAVYGTKKTTSNNMVVVEERPAPGGGREAAPVIAANTPAMASAGGTGSGYHIVKNGETAFSIAKQYGMSMKELREMNNLNFEAIKVGQKLKVK